MEWNKNLYQSSPDFLGARAPGSSPGEERPKNQKVIEGRGSEHG